MNKIKTQQVIKKNIEGNKPEGLNIAAILEVGQVVLEAWDHMRREWMMH